MMRWSRWICAGALALAVGTVRAQSVDQSLLPPADPWALLAVQRSAALINASTPGRIYPVRVVIYGQSICLQKWAFDLLRNLRAWHPQSRFITENRSISSFQMDYLLETANADIYPFRPDIIILQAYGFYGPGGAWERIQREFRSRTTADVIMLSNHPLRDYELTEPTVPGTIPHGTEAWLNYEAGPALANEVGICRPDNRSGLKAYLTAAKLPVKAVLSDFIHFNDFGGDIQMALLRPYLCAPSFHPALDPMNNARIQTHPLVAGGLDWVNGRLRLEFVGNRVDLIAAAGSPGRCRVLVDGAPPTDLPSGMGYHRSARWAADPGYHPGLLRVGFIRKPLLERWTLTVTGVDPDNPNSLQFEVSGAITGPDGEGISTHEFVSRSGRVRIAPGHWNHRARPVVRVGDQLVWDAEERAVDLYGTGVVADPMVETSTTLIHDMVDGPHVLELIAEDASRPPPIAAVRVFHPAGDLFGMERDSAGTPTLRVLSNGREAIAVWPKAATDWQLMSQDPASARWLPASEAPGPAYSYAVRRIPGSTPVELLRLNPR